MTDKTTPSSTFESIFFKDQVAVPISVPDYQRAFSWEKKQIELFIADLSKNTNVSNGYYFGHFIAEDLGKHWEIVDGQQRITTFVLFLMVCQELSLEGPDAFAYTLIERFSTVSYDIEALKTIRRNLGKFFESNGKLDEKNPPSDNCIIAGLSLQETFDRTKGTFTRSQRRMVLALLQFNEAFNKEDLNPDMIANYIEMIMKAHCSYHRTTDKSVAVNIFEMHNTRGMPLTTLEILKATLMKFVYDHGGKYSGKNVEKIQNEFGAIYGMEEALATKSFRGEMTMEQILGLHLRVVDDGKKENAGEFKSPPMNAKPEALIDYVNSNLHYIDSEKGKPKTPEDGVKYALNLAKELKKSVNIVSEILPTWDKDKNQEGNLVGDVLILDRQLSCQFFLLICRRLASNSDNTDGRIDSNTLLLWEKLLFTRDFHQQYHGLWSNGRDNFPALFEKLRTDGATIAGVIEEYLVDGFRSRDVTKDLQSIVRTHLQDNRNNILNNAFNFYPWRQKILYAIYKYEVSKKANIREVMKGKISLEHILPQDWDWDWLDGYEKLTKEGKEVRKTAAAEGIGGFIDGLGNLLLITQSENSSLGKNHPADKRYDRYCSGGSYKVHHDNCEKWRSSENWKDLINQRGELIHQFILDELVDLPPPPQSTNPEAQL
jgi:hypothetical protein